MKKQKIIKLSFTVFILLFIYKIYCDYCNDNKKVDQIEGFRELKFCPLKSGQGEPSNQPTNQPSNQQEPSVDPNEYIPDTIIDPNQGDNYFDVQSNLISCGLPKGYGDNNGQSGPVCERAENGEQGIMTDTSCVNGGAGCGAYGVTVCRFCYTSEDSKISGYKKCPPPKPDTLALPCAGVYDIAKYKYNISNSLKDSYGSYDLNKSVYPKNEKSSDPPSNEITIMKKENVPVQLLDDPRYFYSAGSTNGVGRDVYGNLKDGTGIIEGGLGMTSDKNGKDQLKKYLLTYAAGHPYYKSGDWGYLKSSVDWASFVKTKATNLDTVLNTMDPNITKNKVLLIEGKTKPYSLGGQSKYQFKGIVIRHGGILLIEDKDMEIKTEFILIESGGLLQAGSHFGNANNIYNNNVPYGDKKDKGQYRFKSNLKIILTNPDYGYRYMGVVTSQYSYKVYYPGVNLDIMEDYTGNSNHFSNKFGVKVIAVGFNGNYQMCGQVGLPKPYKGTWAANEIDGNCKYQRNFIDEQTLMTWFDGNNTEQKREAIASNVETDYSMTWARLRGCVYYRGSKTIWLDKRDVGNAYLSEWKKGSQIVITCKTKEFTNDKDYVGMVPLWVDNDKVEDRLENLKANREFIEFWRNKGVEKSDGVEVATIEAINRKTGQVTLRDPLQFNHDSRRVILTRDKSPKYVVVDTNLHVCLLTRNIQITSEFSDIREKEPGCNIFKSNKEHLHHHATGITDGKYNGPGSYVVCNYESDNKAKEVYSECYKHLSEPDKIKSRHMFCREDKPEDIKSGHWIFGSSKKSGCNAIHGGHQMFRYGSSVRLDGVEMKYLGTPPNFGTVGQYPVHFHMAGYAKSFKEFLPSINNIPRDSIINPNGNYYVDRVFARESEVRNCSIWCSFARFVTVHGSHQINVKNNIGFLCYGSGYFVEDGVELNNTFEHNTAIACLTASKHRYWNPLPIYPSVSSDLAPASSFWFKNNQNRCFRNVMSNSPAPIIGIWAVPQDITKLRGPSTVCLGDEQLALPGMATRGNAMGHQEVGGLNKYNKTNKDNSVMDYSTKTPCWMPDNFVNSKAYGELGSRCSAFSFANCENPYSVWSENIIYCMLGGMSEFPEALGMHVGDYRGCGPFGTTNGPHIGVSKKHNEYEGVPQFLPHNANNSCTDSISQCTYFTTKWGGSQGEHYSFKPISDSELNELNKKDYRPVTIADGSHSNTIPKLFSNWLTFNLGPNAGNLWGGAGWIKSSPGWLINCCFLDNGGGSHSTNPNKNCGEGAGFFGKKLTTIFSMTCGDDHNAYTNAYFVIHNLMTNGGVGLPPNPTIISGNKTFIDKKAELVSIEYNTPGEKTNHSSPHDYYFPDFKPFDHFSKEFWKGQNKFKENKVRLNDIMNNQKYYVDWGYVSGGEPYDKWHNTRKYPYICDKNNKLFKVSSSIMPNFNANNPEWLNIVANSQTGHFLSRYARFNLGNKICNDLSKIEGCRKTPQGENWKNIRPGSRYMC